MPLHQTKRGSQKPDLSHVCAGCPIRDRVGFCAAIGTQLPPKAVETRYIMIGEAPGKMEVEHRTPFIGPMGPSMPLLPFISLTWRSVSGKSSTIP